MELQWFFNETTLICLDSKTIGFHVETLYVGRIERHKTAGILLKNVSLNDAGKYTLYVKLAEEKIRNIQHIFLTVDEQVPHHCKPFIEIHPENVLRCSTTCLERSNLSEWIINGTQGPQVGGVKKFCCLRGRKCHNDDEFKFCIPNPITSEVFTEGVPTSTQKKTCTVKAANDECKNTSIVLLIICVIMTSSSLIIIVLINVYFVWRRHKSNQSLDRSNSNQNIQILDNISTDRDSLMQVVESQKMLMISLEAVREETRELKQLLPSYQHPEKLNTRLINKSLEITVVKCEHQNHNDTDASETTSNCEDAVSDPFIP